MATTAPVARHRYAWAAAGDVNAFFGLMLDNVSGMILMTSLLVLGFQFPKEFVLTRMIPGTAIGVLVGDLIYTGLAFALARRLGRDVTAMPLGLDTPSIFGFSLLIVGPAFAAAKARGLEVAAAAEEAWYIGIAMMMAAGIFKLLCAPASGWIRRIVPRAGLLGSLASIALVVISFLPLLKIVRAPVPGMLAMAVILMTLTARWRLPWGIPGALGSVILGCLAYYAMSYGLGALGWATIPVSSEAIDWRLRFDLPMPMTPWWAWLQEHWREAAAFLPVALPLSLATIVGGIDCTESAAAAGDEFSTGSIIATEGLASVVAAVFGGVIQTTPYIGHPAYKAMGGRAAYTLATALFVGLAGILGYFDWIFAVVPEAVILPILLFIALEITSQSFQATPQRHYPALALACIPALAYLVGVPLGRVLMESGKPLSGFSADLRQDIQAVTMLAGGGGFIVTSLLWATALANLIDRKASATALTFGLAAVCALFGVIHSPISAAPLMFPSTAVALLKESGQLEAAPWQTPFHWSAGYLAMALTALVLGKWGKPDPEEPTESV